MAYRKNVFVICLCAVFAITLAKIRIFSPQSTISAFAGKEIIYNYASFGIIPYGTTLTGRVFYFPNNSRGCSKFEEIMDREGDPDSEYSPIVLMERGSCSFVRKIKNAQDAGASLVIGWNYDDQDPRGMSIVDDGTGTQIVIPMMFINNHDGVTLRDEILKTDREAQRLGPAREYVVLTIDFERLYFDDVVKYQLFYTPGDIRALRFLDQMYIINAQYDNRTLFRPHLAITTCAKCSATYIQQHCITEQGVNYCVLRSHIDSMKGKDILSMGIREMCIWEIFNKGDADRYWYFMRTLYHDCASAREAIRMDCHKATMANVGIIQSDIDPCEQKREHILKMEAQAWNESLASTDPAVIINSRVYKGAFNSSNVAEEICRRFNETPEVCSDYVKTIPHNNSSSSSKGTIFLIIVLVLIGNVVIICCYRRCTKKDTQSMIQEQIPSIMSQYLAISDKSGAKPKPLAVQTSGT